MLEKVLFNSSSVLTSLMSSGMLELFKETLSTGISSLIDIGASNALFSFSLWLEEIEGDLGVSTYLFTEEALLPKLGRFFKLYSVRENELLIEELSGELVPFCFNDFNSSIAWYKLCVAFSISFTEFNGGVEIGGVEIGAAWDVLDGIEGVRRGGVWADRERIKEEDDWTDRG